MKKVETDLVADERPEIKSDNGFSNCTTVDLLSLLLGTSNTGVISRARKIMKLADEKVDNLRYLSVKDLTEVEGVGPKSAKAILAAVELGRRIALENADERYGINIASDIYSYMYPRIAALEIEEFWIILMNNNFKLLKAVKISSGGITETAADVRIMMKEAVLSNATVLAACHNHPSGNKNPSRDDDSLTERIKKTCEIMRIYFLDHVIVANNSYYSYRENGRL